MSIARNVRRANFRCFRGLAILQTITIICYSVQRLKAWLPVSSQPLNEMLLEAIPQNFIASKTSRYNYTNCLCLCFVLSWSM